MKDKKGNKIKIKIKTAFIVTTAILALISMVLVTASAQTIGDININEIMYNPPGADVDLEWIELYNNDTTAIDITGWKFYEAGTNHGLTLLQGNMTIPVGGYAIIADNATAFLNDYPECNCTVTDSVFSLRKTEEYIALKNATLDLVDEVTYNASWGADGNGRTLELNATGVWKESLVDGGTPCELNSVAIVIPFSIWGPPVIYTWNITVDAMNPENVGKNATTGLFTATEVIDNETYYVINTSKPTGSTKLYVGKDDVNEDDLRKRVVTVMEPGVEIVNLTFDPAFVNWDFPLWDRKTWNGTTNVTGMLVNETGSVIQINSTAVVSGKITAEVVTVPLGTFPCLVIETNISYEVAGQPTSNLEKSWISPTDNGYLTPKYQSYLNGTLVDELELIEVIPPTFLNATDNNTEVNVTIGEFLVIILEANPTTGYTWEVTEPVDELVLRQVGEIAFVPESDLIGAGGVQIATFEAVGAGEATIKLVYHRPWETEVEPLDTFTVNVTVANGLDAIPPLVTSASANPPVIVVNTGITELRVDAAGIDSPIDVVTIDLSPIGGNASTVMFNIGNYTEDNILWTMFSYTTNASVEGTFNLTMNATDINRNYNDTVNIRLEVKKAVIPFSMITPGTTYRMNITHDVIPPNVGQNATIDWFSETAVIDGETYYIGNATKPIGGTKFYVDANFTTEDFTMKRVVIEGAPGVEVLNLTYDPACVLYDYPLRVGKTWTTTVNVTGKLVDAATGAEIPIDTSAVVTGNVTREEYLTVPYGTNIHCLVVEINVSLQNPPISILMRQWWSNNETALMPKIQSYVSGNLTEELELIEVKKNVIPFPTFQPMSYISNITFDAMIPDNVGKNATTEQFTSTKVIDNETYYVVNTSKPTGGTKMYVGVDVVNEDLTTKRMVREREPGVEVTNLTYDPEFLSRDFPLGVGKNWTATTNVTGMLVNRTGAVILIDTNAVVSGAVTDEVNLTVPYGTIHCLVVEVNVNLQDPPVSFLTRYWLGYDETNEMLIIPKSQRYSNENLSEELELIEIVAP